MTGKRRDGGVDLVIVASQPLDDEAEVMIESRRVRIRVQDWKNTKPRYHNVTIPTDGEMERIAAELHAKGETVRIDVLGWHVVYFRMEESSYTTQEVNPFTGERGEVIEKPIPGEARCVFGFESDVWRVNFRWQDGDDIPYRRNELGTVVGPAIVQRELFDDSRPESVTASSDFTLADEVVDPVLLEGAVQRIEVNAYERNPEARRQCIEHWGFDCAVCGFNFGNRYGEIGDGFIHVHHLRDLATIGQEYEVDPMEDLRPVCPNCHAMLHTTLPAMSIEDLRRHLRDG